MGRNGNESKKLRSVREPGLVTEQMDQVEVLLGITEHAAFGTLHPEAIGRLLVIVTEQMQEAMNDITHQFSLAARPVSRRLDKGHFHTHEDLAMNAART